MATESADLFQHPRLYLLFPPCLLLVPSVIQLLQFSLQLHHPVGPRSADCISLSWHLLMQAFQLVSCSNIFMHCMAIAVTRLDAAAQSRR